jgi:hypothetical protein
MTPLYQANRCPMQPAMVCEGFLAEATLCAQLSHPFSQCQENLLHAREFGSRLRIRLQTDRWQTICYKRLVVNNCGEDEAGSMTWMTQYFTEIMKAWTTRN